MTNEIDQYRVVLEIGCGTGQSTLSLIEAGHKVIAVEKNNFCIEKSKSLIRNKGYSVGDKYKSLCEYDVLFINDDIMNRDFVRA